MVIIVTGAASGIGRVVAQELAAADYSVVASDIEANALAESGTGALTVPADVTDEAQVDRLVQATVERYGRIDGLVHCAGIEEPPTAAISMTAQTFRATVDVNLYGSFVVAKAVAAQMVAAGSSGSLVLVGSVLSEAGWGGNAAYTASKGGVLQLGRALAVELGPKDIRVNVIGPGLVAAPMSAATIGDPVRGPKLLERIPLGRFARPTDVASTARFLLSDAAAYITAAFIPVDGGLLSLAREGVFQ